MFAVANDKFLTQEIFGKLRMVQRRPTQRAVDGGYAARFWSLFLALGFSRFDSESKRGKCEGTNVALLWS